MPAPSDADVVARLTAAGCVAAVEEAGRLTEAAPDADTLDTWVRRREDGEPLAWITGRVTFAGLELHADAGVYVPRPHSEELAGRALRVLPSGGRAVDLCTGTGAVAAVVAAHDRRARVVGTDLDPRAARCARRNGVRAVVCDLADAIGGDATWDLVTAVAPYVPTDAIRFLPSDVQAHEPRRALDGGADGLDHVRRVLHAAARLLRPGGRALVEVGGDQDDTIATFAARHGFDAAETWCDTFGDARGVALVRNGLRGTARAPGR